MSRQSLQLELASRPTAAIIPGQTFRQRTVAAPTAADLHDGEVLLELLYLSLDPAMRGWLNDARSYLPPVGLGDVMRGAGLARVLASRAAHVRPGALVAAPTGFREVARLPAAQVDEAPAAGRPTDLLGVLGITGLTAYFGVERIGRPRAGDTVVVSAAAGATGSVVVQMAKMRGARVVGLAGTEAKVRWLVDELGADVALNYKDAEFAAKFAEATPEYIDMFWDNVGGEQLDMALKRANKFARFVMCGAISQYNAEQPSGPKNMMNVVAQSITMQGFIVLDYAAEFAAARKQLAQWLDEGKIKRQETVVKGGLQAAEHAFEKLFTGENMGKLLLEVKNPAEAAKL